MKDYKPKNYNSLSCYLIVDDANKLAEQLKIVFNATELRRIEHEGRIRHLELKIDDTVLMMSNSVEGYPAQKTMLHCYVPDVFETFENDLKNGCEKIDEPFQRENDDDIRGSFYDLSGNYWAISTQKNKVV